MKRLKPGNPLSALGNTHVCVAEVDEDEFGGNICNHPLTLHKRIKGYGHSWITTRAVEHYAKMHKDTVVSQQFNDRPNVSHEKKVNQQIAYGKDTASEVSKDAKSTSKTSTISKLDRFVKLTPSQRQLSSQAQWYVYSDQKISKRSFENTYFKKMLQVSLLMLLVWILR